MELNIESLIGETTAYDKKQMLEIKHPKSWLKSVSAFANGEGGMLLFGISDDNRIVGLNNAECDAEKISEEIKAKLDPVPTIDLSIKKVDEKKLVILQVYPGQETPYYYTGDKQRLAFVRVGNESVTADRIQLKNLVMKGSGRTFDGLPSAYKFRDMSFTRLRSIHYKRLQRSLEENEFVSWGILDENGRLTNAGALLADDSPMRQSRLFCTRWNGLNMTNGLMEALDDAELVGCVVGQLQDAVSFVRNNSKKRWWKESDHREELPDYPERAVTEALANAIIHRDYMQMGSEIHLDMYDNRLEIYSPGGMLDGRLIQQLNPLSIPSKRRNPLLADFFSRLGLMERRGSGMKKIIEAYRQYEGAGGYRAPEFTSNATEFHVVLWNLNYEPTTLHVVEKQENIVTEFVKEEKEFVKEGGEFVKKEKEFVKAGRKIYNLISCNSKVSAAQMAESMQISSRQVQKYLKRLQDAKKIIRVGGRKSGEWKIVDEDYEGFFDRM
jgi:predicted HTH transcriptional regulator